MTVIDLYTRECLSLCADRSLTGLKVAEALTRVLQRRAAPQSITVDNGSEFVSRAMDAWAYAHDIKLEFFRPGKPSRMRSSRASTDGCATNASIATCSSPSTTLSREKSNTPEDGPVSARPAAREHSQLFGLSGVRLLLLSAWSQRGAGDS